MKINTIHDNKFFLGQELHSVIIKMEKTKRIKLINKSCKYN